MPPDSPAAAGQLEAEVLAHELTEARIKYLEREIPRPSKREIMWFSDIHSCDRRNYYAMVHGDERRMWDAFVQARIKAGREWEAIIKKELLELGYEPMLAGEVVEIKKGGRILARGKTDLSLRKDKLLIPTEIKCVQRHIYDAVQKWEDLFRFGFTEKYIRQEMLYMYGKNIEQGLFILCDFQGHWKPIVVYLDYAYCEQTLQRIERAILAKDKGQVPDRIPYSEELCGRCDFAALCLPDLAREEIATIESDELLAKLRKRDELKAAAKEYRDLDDEVKAVARGYKRVLVGAEYIIDVKEYKTTTFDVPDDVKLKYATETTRQKISIGRIDGKSKPAEA